MKTSFYKPNKHIKNLINNNYYKNLILLRNAIGIASANYFQSLEAPRIDLFMVAKGVSSPMGKGSDSLPIPFQLGKEHVYLVDSAQFGMEPLVQKSFKMVYCYLPSFRGEDADYRHLNQFYHCEAELRGNLTDAIIIAENLVKKILEYVIENDKLGTYKFDKANFSNLEHVISSDFPRLTFDKAVNLLISHGMEKHIENREYGRVISREGELKICELISDNKLPVWLTHFDRDVVPFYQLPDPNNPEKVLNADLLFPSINGGFGGEIVGLGQRQNTSQGLLESMDRQGIKDKKSYQWYLDLRDRKDYSETSGFGMGIERLIAWALALPNIWDAAIYPVIKDEGIYY